LSPFLSKPLPSQFLHFCFFLMFGPFSLTMKVSCRNSAVLYGGPSGTAGRCRVKP
jgi:hypothetical protein